MGSIRKPGAKTKAQIARAVRDRQKEEKDERIADLALDNVRPIRVKRKNTTVAQIQMLDEIEMCLRMTVNGFTPAQIAKESEEILGRKISEQRVINNVKREMAKVRDPLVSEIRKMEDLRLQYLQTKLAPMIDTDTPNLDAMKESRQISETRRKMWGADMPANVRVTGEVMHTLDPAVAELFADQKQDQARQEAQQRQAALEDPAIIDAEIVEPDFRDEPYQELEPEDDETEDFGDDSATEPEPI